MSRASLHIEVEKFLRAEIESTAHIKIDNPALKKGQKASKNIPATIDSPDSMRVILDKNITTFDFSPLNIKKGSKLKIIGKGTKQGLNNPQAIYFSNFILKYFKKRTKAKAVTEEELINELSTLSTRKRGGGKSKIFSIKVKKGKIIYKLKDTVYIPKNSGGLLISSNFGKVQTHLKTFSEQLEDFLSNGTLTTTYLGVSLKEFLNGMLLSEVTLASETFGRKEKLKLQTNKKDKTVKLKTVVSTNIHVGHIGGSRKSQTSISEARVESAMIKLSEHYADNPLVQAFVKLERDSNSKRFASTHMKYSSKYSRFADFYKLLGVLEINFIETVPHRAITNVSLGGEEKYNLNFYTSKGTGEDPIQGNVKIKNAFEKLKKDMPHLKGSPSIIKMALNKITGKFFSDLRKIGKRNKAVKVITTKEEKYKTKYNTKVSGSIPNKRKIVPISVGKAISDIEIYSGRFEIEIPENIEEEASCRLPARKLLAIQGRIQYELHDVIKETMKLPALVYRTGRFAKSVKIAGIKQNPDCTLTAFYRYMVAPYAVFDPSISRHGGLSSPDRNPQKIIGDSIRSIAQRTMRDKYIIHPQWV